MKNSLRFLTAALAVIAGVSAFAQSTGNATTPPAHGPHFGPPPGVVNADGTITLPDGTVLPAPTVNADGTITLPDGTVIDPSQMPEPPAPPVKNDDGSITLADGTIVQPNADGTYTLPDGHVIDLSKAPPAGGPGGPGGPGDHRGPPPAGE
jgi:hypothetical protein